MLLLLVTFIIKKRLNSTLLKEAHTLMMLILCKKLLNIVDKTVILLQAVTFIKCINYFTNKGYTDFLIFIRTEKYRSRVMTSAGNQPFCSKNKSV